MLQVLLLCRKSSVGVTPAQARLHPRRHYVVFEAGQRRQHHSSGTTLFRDKRKQVTEWPRWRAQRALISHLIIVGKGKQRESDRGDVVGGLITLATPHPSALNYKDRNKVLFTVHSGRVVSFPEVGIAVQQVPDQEGGLALRPVGGEAGRSALAHQFQGMAPEEQMCPLPERLGRYGSCGEPTETHLEELQHISGTRPDRFAPELSLETIFLRV